MIPKITLTDAPTPEMRKAIVEPLVEFNHSRIGKPETYRPLAILLSEPGSDEIVGGLHGVTAFSYLWIGGDVMPPRSTLSVFRRAASMSGLAIRCSECSTIARRAIAASI